MNRFTTGVVKFLKAEHGPTAVEYAVLLAFIVIVSLGAIASLGGNAKKAFKNMAATTASGS